MATDPKSILGIGHSSGSQPYTTLGNSLKSSIGQHEQIGVDSVKIYYGTLYDVRLPIGDTDVAEDGLPGTWAKMHFDSAKTEKQLGNKWFVLKHDPSQLLMEYGTLHSIRSLALRVMLRIEGAAIDLGTVIITGDQKQENVYREYDKTPTKAFADMITGISQGKLPWS